MSIAVPYVKGEQKLVFEAGPPDDELDWFINDHCFVEAKDGVLHMIGINNPFPPEGKQLYAYHPFLGHATTTDPLKGWTRQPFAIDDSQNEEYLGAPVVIWDEIESNYLMIYEAKINEKRGLETARSDDLFEWRRKGEFIPSDLPYTSRDPCVFNSDSGDYVVYLCTPEPHSSISLIRTTDFKTYSNPEVCLFIPDEVSCGGLESPYVIKHDDLLYMFVTYAHRRYSETLVITSDDMAKFPLEDTLTTLHAHAAEIVTYKGKQLISSCGPEGDGRLNRHGLYMTELGWAEPVD